MQKRLLSSDLYAEGRFHDTKRKESQAPTRSGFLRLHPLSESQPALMWYSHSAPRWLANFSSTRHDHTILHRSIPFHERTKTNALNTLTMRTPILEPETASLNVRRLRHCVLPVRVIAKLAGSFENRRHLGLRRGRQIPNVENNHCWQSARLVISYSQREASSRAFGIYPRCLLSVSSCGALGERLGAPTV